MSTFGAQARIVARGGARNRSGPQPEEGSRTSDRKGYILTALPAAGFDGQEPDFPLPAATQRELEVWEREWRSPVACWWSERPDLWADVAMFVRFSVRLEGDEPKGTDIQGYMRLKDHVARSPAGEKERGLKVAAAPADSDNTPDTAGPQRPSARDRLRVVGDV